MSVLVACGNCNNYLRCKGLKKHKLTLFWRAEVKNQFHSANSKVLAGPHSIWKREGNIHLLALPDLRGRLHSLAPGHTAPTSASAVAISFSDSESSASLWSGLFCLP